MNKKKEEKKDVVLINETNKRTNGKEEYIDVYIHMKQKQCSSLIEKLNLLPFFSLSLSLLSYDYQHGDSRIPKRSIDRAIDGSV